MTLSPGRLGAVTTLGLHAVVIGALLAYAPTRSALFSAAPIMVDWIVAARPEPRVVEPPTERPKPVKVTPKPVEKPPVAVRPEEAPTPMAVPTPPPPPSV